MFGGIYFHGCHTTGAQYHPDRQHQYRQQSQPCGHFQLGQANVLAQSLPGKVGPQHRHEDLQPLVQDDEEQDRGLTGPP